MDFFEGKRARELRGAFEGALDATLEPPSMRVRHPTVIVQTVEKENLEKKI